MCKRTEIRRVAVVVAHPDDETLWAGGLLLDHPQWQTNILCLCRGSDLDRAPKFRNACAQFGADGEILDLDDGPEQRPLDPKLVEESILAPLPFPSYDLVLAHSPFGEYTRHKRHEEIGKAVINLWHNKNLVTTGLWLFAYEDGYRNYYPRPIGDADFKYPLSQNSFERKYKMITETYGFARDSWEAEACPKSEAFWKFSDPTRVFRWQRQDESKGNGDISHSNLIR